MRHGAGSIWGRHACDVLVGQERPVARRDATYLTTTTLFLSYYVLLFQNYHEKANCSVYDVLGRCFAPSLFTLRVSHIDSIRPVDYIHRQNELHFYMSMRGVILTRQKHKMKVNKADKEGPDRVDSTP